MTSYGNRSIVPHTLPHRTEALLASVAHPDEAVHPRQNCFLTVRGRRLHVLERGDGPCVVLLHGNGSMIEELQASGLIESLADDHRVIAFDRPGFGRSERPLDEEWTPEVEAEFLAEALTMLGVEDPVIVGHSWGTLVAINLALRKEGVSALVLVSGYYAPSSRLEFAFQEPVSMPIISDWLRHTILPFMAHMSSTTQFRQMFSPLPVSPEFLAAYPVAMACRPSQLKSVADDTVEMPKAAARLASRFLQLSIPVHLIAGTDDQVVSSEHQSAWLHANLPGSTLQMLPGVGHMVHHANPELVAGAVRGATFG